jgi:hypothetical protein
MEKSAQVQPPTPRVSEPYSEPLLIKHEPLRNITGTKYGEKAGNEKVAVEGF